ncbi:MAG: hypothetical protein HY673_21625 [Chloroflexi bacterium]|nr:hypothetical protein [Chloroflexota bacterium]
MRADDLLKEWMPIVHTLCEAEAHIYSGKLRAFSIPSTVFHNTIYTAIFGYNSLDRYLVIVPVRCYRHALMVLGATSAITYDHQQTLGMRYDFWIVYNLSVPGLVLATVRNLRRRKQRRPALAERA